MAGADALFFVDGNQADNAGAGNSPQTAWKTVTHAIGGTGTAAAVATAISNRDKPRIIVIGEINPTNQGVGGTAALVQFGASTPTPEIWNPVIIEATPYLDGSVPDWRSAEKVRWDATGHDYVFFDNSQDKPNYIFRNIDGYRSSSDAYGGAGHGFLFSSTQYGITFDNCRAVNHLGVGFSTAYYDLMLINCIAELCNKSNNAGFYGIRASQVLYSQIINCRNTGALLRCENFQSSFIGNIVRDCPESGVWMTHSTGAPAGGVIDKSTFYNCGTAINFRHTTSTTAGSAHNFKVTNSIISTCTKGLDCPETESNKIVRPYVRNVLMHANTTNIGNVDPLGSGIFYGDPGFADLVGYDFTVDPSGDAVLADGAILGAKSVYGGFGGGAGNRQYFFT